MDGAKTVPAPTAAFSWLAEAVADPECTFSLGAFGAVGEFPSEPRRFVDIRTDRIEAATATAKIALVMSDDLRPIAFETISSDPEGWNHGIALCLPERKARMSGLNEFAAIGPDTDALEISQRNLCCYDLGLGSLYADICVRPLTSPAPSVASAGQSADANGLIEQFRDDTWVFKTALGRIETCCPRRRHLIPSLLSSHATHSNTAPIPAGFIPVGYVFPPMTRHPGTKNAFLRHEAFQRLIDCYGDRALARFKRRVEAMLDVSLPPEALSTLLGHQCSPSRAEIACIRIVLRQRRWRLQEQDQTDWERTFDRPLSRTPPQYSNVAKG